MFLSCHVCVFRVNPHSSWLSIKELCARSRCKIWILNDCNWTWTHSHLVHKWTLNYLAKKAKWLRCVVSTYLSSAFDCMFLSCHICVFRVNPNSIVAWMSRNSMLKWLQLDSSPQPLSSQMNTQPFSQTGQMIFQRSCLTFRQL